MYFDSTTFKRGLRAYTEPFGRIIRDSLFSIPPMWAETKKECLENWETNKPKSLGGALTYIVWAPFALAVLLVMLIWLAIYNPESEEVGWLIYGIFLAVYACSIPVVFLGLLLFNIKFGRFATTT